MPATAPLFMKKPVTLSVFDEVASVWLSGFEDVAGARVGDEDELIEPLDG